MSRIFMLTSILLFLTGCQGIAEMELVNIMLTDSPESTPVQTPVLTLEPWQAAYRDILLHPEEYEEFYAVAQHIPSDQSKLVTYYQGITPHTYAFAICDINADGTAELLLQGTSPRVLLNILHYNAETGTVEDMDGPRTYPLMDGLYIYENGYLWTQNGAGGLYTECWRLEDEDPEHYWYGFERPWDASYDGPRSTDDIHFRDSNGGELGYWEFYALLGEPVSHIEWLEATPDNIEKAFLPNTGEEEP